MVNDECQPRGIVCEVLQFCKHRSARRTVQSEHPGISSLDQFSKLRD
jgi:hypothetical protein